MLPSIYASTDPPKHVNGTHNPRHVTVMEHNGLNPTHGLYSLFLHPQNSDLYQFRPLPEDC